MISVLKIKVYVKFTCVRILNNCLLTYIRFSLNDDWAYANETRSKSWDFQSEEAALKTAVERFNSRRYSHLYPAFALG